MLAELIQSGSPSYSSKATLGTSGGAIVRNGIASSLRREFKNLRGALQSLDYVLRTIIAMNGSVPAEPRRRPRLSPKARASLVLQGRYMGFMRQLKPRQKAQVRKIKEAKGVRAAIVRARSLAGS
jgi:hypothetical protein